MKKEFKWEYDQPPPPRSSNETGLSSDKGGSYGGYGSTGGFDNSSNRLGYEKEKRGTTGWGSVRDAIE